MPKSNPMIRVVTDNTRDPAGNKVKPMRLFSFFTDGRRGYLYVPFKDLEDMGLTPYSFTAFSRIDARGMYLEEEMDAQIFTEVYEQKGGFRVVFHEVHEESSTLREKQNNTISNAKKLWEERQTHQRLRTIRGP